MKRESLDVLRSGWEGCAAARLSVVLTCLAIANCTAISVTKYEGGCDNENIEGNSFCCGKTMFIFNGVQSSRQRPEDNYRCCMSIDRKGEIYKPEEAVCCNGRVHHIGTSYHLKCCNGLQLFDSSTHVCCVGEDMDGTDYGIHKKLPQHLCCGKEFYDNVTHMCCSSSDGKHNVVHELPHDEAQELIPHRQTACCGTSIYNTESGHVCRQDHIMHMSKLCEQAHVREQYSNDTHLCCSGKVASKAEYTCCQGQLHDLIPGSVCCGRYYVEESTHICCNGSPHRIDNQEHELECCGSRTYDVKTQICVGGMELVENRYESFGLACISRNSTQIIIMDSRKHMCCNGLPYLGANYLCCNNTAVRKLGPIMRCCGSKAYHPITHECTPSAEVRNCSNEERNANQSMCNGRKINPQTTICCSDRRLSRLRGDTCCGDKNYFRNSPVSCCNHKLTAGPCKVTTPWRL